MTMHKHDQPSSVLRGFSKRLKYQRQLKNLTQEALAARVGLSLRQLIRIEQGSTSPQFALLDRLCQALETSPVQFFLFQDIPAKGSETTAMNPRRSIGCPTRSPSLCLR